MSKSEVAKRFKQILINSTHRQIGETKKVGLLLSGGIDSLGVAYCLQELDREIHPYTFYLENNESQDLKASRKISKIFGWDLTEVMIPRETVKEDIITLAKHYNCVRKVAFETNIHLLHTFPQVKEKVLCNGLFRVKVS